MLLKEHVAWVIHLSELSKGLYWLSLCEKSLLQVLSHFQTCWSNKSSWLISCNLWTSLLYWSLARPLSLLHRFLGSDTKWSSCVQQRRHICQTAGSKVCDDEKNLRTLRLNHEDQFTPSHVWHSRREQSRHWAAPPSQKKKKKLHKQVQLPLTLMYHELQRQRRHSFFPNWCIFGLSLFFLI